MEWVKIRALASKWVGGKVVTHALATAFRAATPYTIGNEMPLIFW